jgi:hypothetical protein
LPRPVEHSRTWEKQHPRREKRESRAVERVSATRSELLARRGRISLAVQGRELLKEERTALMREFERLSASALAAMRDL